MAQYAVDNTTGAALTSLKECIDKLPPEHLRALVNLLVTHPLCYPQKCLCMPCTQLCTKGTQTLSLKRPL